MSNAFEGYVGKPSVKERGSGRKPSGGGSKSYKPSGGRPTEQEQRDVVSMQSAMRDLGKGIQKNAKVLSEGPLKGYSEDDIKILGQAVQQTAQGQRTALDGKWGQNTTNALRTINSDIVNKLKVNKVNVGEVKEGTNYKKRDDKEVIADAKSNVVAIVSIVKTLNLGNEFMPKGSVPINFDHVPLNYTSWTDRTMSPISFAGTTKNSLSIDSGNLSNMPAFYNFIARVMGKVQEEKKVEDKKTPIAKKVTKDDDIPENPYNTAKALKELSNQIIKNAGIVKFSQSETGAKIIRENPFGNDKTPETPKGSILYKDFDQAINWLWKRSNMLERYMMSLYEGKTVNPATKKTITTKDVAKARLYKESVRKIAILWEKKYAGWFRRRGYVTPDGFLRADVGESPGGSSGTEEQGSGRNERNRGGRNRGRDRGTGHSLNLGEGGEALQKYPPLQSLMNFKTVREVYGINKLTKVINDIKELGVSRETMDLRLWESRNPKTIARYFVDHNTMQDTERAEGVQKLGDLVAEGIAIIRDYIDKAYSQVYDSRIKKIIRRQNDMATRWNDAIRSTKSKALRWQQAGSIRPNRRSRR